MSVIRLHYLSALAALAGIASIGAASRPAELQAGSRRHQQCVSECCCSPVCGPAVLTAGDQPADLQVHIVGDRYDTIEAFFKTELFYRETLPATCNLHCGQNVVLAPGNPNGTFAVRYGKHADSFRIYGWKKDQEKPEIKELTLEAGHAVRLTWVTTRILKVHYGPCQAKEFIIRFNDSDTPWTVLYPGP